MFIQTLPQNIQQYIYLAISYLRGMWRNRWQFMLISWLVCLGGWVWTFNLKDMYRSQAAVTIQDPQSNVRPILSSIASLPTVTWEAARELQNLATYTNLTRALQFAGIITDNTPPQQVQDMVTQLQRQVRIFPQNNNANSNLWYISYDHTTPDLPPRIVQGILDVLANESGLKGLTMRGQVEVSRLLSGHVENQERKMAESEIALREYHRQWDHLMPGRDGGYYQRLQNLNSQLDEQRQKLSAAENKRSEIIRRMEGEEPETGDKAARESLLLYLQSYKERKEKLLSQYFVRSGNKVPLYTEDHPNVKVLQRYIDDIERRLHEPVKPVHVEKTDSEERRNDPAYLTLKSSLDETEMEITAIKARIAEAEKDVVELRKLEDILPRLESELLKLQRDYNTHREKFLKLLGQKEEVDFKTELLDGMAESITFKVTQPPNRPQFPYGPDRKRFYTVSLVGGIMAGLAMSLFLSLIRPVFDSRTMLQQVMGLPVLGTISLISLSKDRWYSSRLAFFAALFTLFGIYGVMLYSRNLV